MLLWIALSVGLQILLYVLLRRKKGYVRLLLLLFFLLLNAMVFPTLYGERLSQELGDQRCGMYMIGVWFGFWTIGGGLTILTHIGFLIIRPE